MTQKEHNKNEARVGANIKKNFDKYLLFSNIRELLKNSDVKIGEIEKQAGCYPGYMSRLDKKDNTTEPSVEFVMTAAKLLATSIDLITNCNLGVMNPTERYLADFFDQLIKETTDDQLDWTIRPAQWFEDIPTDEEGDPIHPLFGYDEYTEILGDRTVNHISGIIFRSNSFDTETWIPEDCYEFNLRSGNPATLYLMNVGQKFHDSGDSGERAKEIWIAAPNGFPEFLASNRGKTELASIVEKLFNTVRIQTKYPKLKPNVKNIIDAYLKGIPLGTK